MAVTTRHRRRWIAAVAASVSMAALLTGCATQQQAEGGTSTSSTNSNYYKAAVAEAKAIANGKKLNPSLSMIGSNSGAEGQTLQDVYKAFTEGAGVKVNYTGSQDITAIVQSRVQAGDPPDVADISAGTALQYAKEGKLVDLSAAFGSELKDNFSPSLLADASYDGKVIGVYQGFSNFMLWYNPKSYTGPKNPTAWSQIVDWTNAQAAKGTPVWCAAQNAGPESGFPGAQFIENIFLKQYGPTLYRQWGEGQLPWTSTQVKTAFQEFGDLIVNNKNVSGGVTGALAAPIATGYNGLTASPATCQATLWGSWVPGLIGSSAVPGTTIDFYRVPATDPKYENDELFQTTESVGFTDNATTKAFLQFMASTAAQKYLASLNRWPVANVHVPASIYPSSALQEIAKTYFAGSSTQLDVGPNMLANAAVQTAFFKGVVSYMQNPSSLDQVLQSIQAAQK